MTIRITTSTALGVTIIKVDGRLQYGDLEVLWRTVSGAEGTTALDLSDLQSIDRDAATVVRDQLSRNIELRHVTPYVAMLLRADRNADGSKFPPND